MIVSNKYTKIERNGMYYIIPSSAPECPHCGGAMTVRDSKRRKMILSDGTVQMFVLRRYKCKICGRIHLNLPDIMLPHKHYAPGGDHRDGERRAELFGGAVDDLPLEPGETAAGMSGASDGEGSRKGEPDGR